MLKYFRTNFKYRLAALFLAVIIWFFVFEEQNPVQERVLNVPLEARGLEKGLVIASKPNSVNVRFQGRKQVVDDVTARDIKAYVRMNNAHVGDNMLPVYVDLPPAVSLVAVEPTYAEVQVDAVTSVQLPVSIKISGSAAQGYKLGKPMLNPDQVMILGPKNVLENIGEVYVEVRLKNNKEDYLENLPVKLEDKIGSPIYHEWVSTSPQTVEVFIPITGEELTRQVPIVYQLEGEPAANREVKNVEIFPEVVQISAESEDLLYKTNFIPVTINLEGSKESLELEIPLQTPEGIKVVGIQEVKVLVEIGAKD